MTASNLHILYVEDNPGDVFLVRTGFKRFQFTPDLVVVEDGLAALHSLKQPETRLPDLILLDLNLPRMNGYEVLAQLKKDPDLRDIPVVVYSGSLNPNDKQRVLDLGACLFVEKPAKIDGVLDLIKNISSVSPRC